jgi:hypothetical protein
MYLTKDESLPVASSRCNDQGEGPRGSELIGFYTEQGERDYILTDNSRPPANGIVIVTKPLAGSLRKSK